MNSNSSSSGSSAHSNSSALPAFVPAFYASSYGDDLDDDELEFSPEHVHSANTLAFATDATTIPASIMSAPPAFSYAAAASAHHSIALDDDDDDDALFVPKTTYRDTHHVFANGPCDLVFHSDAFLESSVYSHAGKAPTFVLESAATVTKQQKTASLALPLVTASPLSPSSYSAKIDVPQKQSASYFCVNPVLSSRAAPSAIMAALEAALRQFECEFEVVQHWSIRASLLCVAEEIAFTLSLARVGADAYEVDFLHRSGDETKFVHIAEHIRGLCADIDDDALPLCLQEPLDAWFDATQELSGRQYVIKDKTARELLATLTSSDQHPDTLYEFAKTLKDHCRVKQNRKLFVQSDRASLLEALKWLLGDSDECARFGVFILAQFAKDCSSGSADASLFETPFDKSAFALLLDDVRSRQRDAPCSKFALAMVERVQQSELFC